MRTSVEAYNDFIYDLTTHCVKMITESDLI